MTDRDWLAARFDEQRPQLRRVAYRMLGTLDEADDAVQEAWLRLSRTDTDAIENLGGWLTTVVGRVSLDMLRARRARHETYVGSWLPEPIVTVDDSPNPEEEALVADCRRPRAVRRARNPDSARTPRLRAPRHVRCLVRGDRSDPRPEPGCGATTREPCPSPRSRCKADSEPRPAGTAPESWTRSSRRRGRETSRRSSPSSTPRSSSASTPAPTNGEPVNRSAAREKSPSSY